MMRLSIILDRSPFFLLHRLSLASACGLSVMVILDMVINGI
jgi:hypothetical protein